MAYRTFPQRRIADVTLGEVVNEMCRLAVEGASNIDVRHHALDLVRGVESGNYTGEIAAVYRDSCPPNFRYVQDPVGVEYLQGLQELLQTNQGDCDDISIRQCGILGALGHASSMVIVGFGGGPPSHVFARAETPNGPIVMDPVANVRTRKMLRDITNHIVVPVPMGAETPIRGGVMDGPFHGWAGWPG